MIWDFEDIFFATVISCFVLLLVWLLWSRSRLGWSNSRTAGFYISAYCLGAFVLVLFEFSMSFVGAAEIQGQVSHIDLRYPPGRKGDHSRFEVTSPKGLSIKLASENRVAEHVRIGETVYVRYNPLNSEPVKVERFDGANRQVLYDARNFPIFRIFPVVNGLMLLLMALGAIFGFRKFRAASN
jgi:hypothetical protein